MESTTAYKRIQPKVPLSTVSAVSSNRNSLDDTRYNVDDGTPRGHSATPETLAVSDTYSTRQGIPEEPEDIEEVIENEPAWYWKFMGWSIEITSLLGSFLIIAAIAGLLKFYDGKTMSNTPSRPSLNTIISILSMAFTALITGAITAAISQSKWSWYRKPKPLAHLDVVDGVSRGARGALLALFHPRIGYFSIFGAILVLSTVVIGPTLQETVAYSSLSIPDPTKNATVPIAQVYESASTENYRGNAVIDLPMKSAMLDALMFSEGNNTAISSDCSTGNCTFTDPYTSIGVCHSCEAAEVIMDCPEKNDGTFCTYAIPNGHSMNTNLIPHEEVIINGSTLYDNNNNSKHSLNIADISIISLTNAPNCTMDAESDFCTLPYEVTTPGKNQSVVGAECNLRFCLKSYTAEMSGSKIEEKIIEQSTNERYLFMSTWDVKFVMLANPCFVNGQAYTYDQYTALNTSTPDIVFQTLPMMYNITGNYTAANGINLTIPTDCVFSTNHETVDVLQNFLQDNEEFFDRDGLGYMDGLDVEFFADSFGIEPLFNSGNASFESIDSTFDNIATAMTNHIRQSGNAANRTTAQGVVLEMETVLVVGWYWLIPSGVILLCSCAYLIAAILQTAATASAVHERTWRWKSNPLALLLLGINSRSIESVDPLSTERVLHKLAKDVKVQLVKTENGWVLMENMSSPLASEKNRLGMSNLGGGDGNYLSDVHLERGDLGNSAWDSHAGGRHDDSVI